MYPAFLVNDLDRAAFGSWLLFLLTESMSSIVSANSGMVCSVDSTVLASAARNLLGETASCGGGPCGISGPCQNRLSSSSRGLVQPVVSASSDTLSGHVVYSSWGQRARSESWIPVKADLCGENDVQDITSPERIKSKKKKYCLAERKQENKKRQSMDVEVRVKGNEWEGVGQQSVHGQQLLGSASG